MKRIGIVLLSLALLAGCAGEAEKAVPEKEADPAGAALVTSDTLYVEKIENLPEDFFLGADVSSLLAEEQSGVVYKNFDGQTEDMLKVLADSGLNCVRVRVWVDPFDRDGRGYGGGNCTAETAGEIGARAAKYGLKLLVDFHYSDLGGPRQAADPQGLGEPGRERQGGKDQSLHRREPAAHPERRGGYHHGPDRQRDHQGHLRGDLRAQDVRRLPGGVRGGPRL